MKKANTVTIKVKLGAATNIARAGSGKDAKIASSTNSGAVAAFCAAIEYFGTLPRGVNINVHLAEKGSVSAPAKREIYTAVLSRV